MIESNPAFILQNLIRFDTTNPPGKEEECIYYIQSLLTSAGIDSEIFYTEQNRANLVSRVKGKGESSPILLYGHVDVVTTSPEEWIYPPFDGVVAEDCVWGRGALDMKGAIAMMLTALLKIKKEGITPPGDIILAIVSDEEVGGSGASCLVERHKELFENVKYGIGESGGHTQYIFGKRFYPINISEKQYCCLKLVFKGKGGHGSIPIKNGAMAKAGEFLSKINEGNFVAHITPPVKILIEELVKQLPAVLAQNFEQLLDTNKTNEMIKKLDFTGLPLESLFHNTINPTIISGGEQVNVIPREVAVLIDGRLLPGIELEEYIKEVKAFSGDAELTVLEFNKGPATVDLGLFETLGEIIKELDTEGIPIPYMGTGVTDGRIFYHLGIHTYGFTPMLLDEDFDVNKLIHADNERIPLKSLEFGADAFCRLFRRF